LWKRWRIAGCHLTSSARWLGIKGQGHGIVTPRTPRHGQTQGLVNGWPSWSKLGFSAPRTTHALKIEGLARWSLGGDACVPIVDGPEKDRLPHTGNEGLREEHENA